jgi:cysteine desulfurase/selenocysteine lyase
MRNLMTDNELYFTALRNDFPILQQLNRGKPLVYLDSAASAQKPISVIDVMSHFYGKDYANIHRGIYELSERATNLFENARELVKTFIHAPSTDTIIFVRGTTEGINLVAQTYGQRFKKGDEMIVSMMEHHANIVPWYLLAKQIGLNLKIIPVTDAGALDMTAYKQLFSPLTKMVAVTHASNVLGTINPIRDLADIAHAHNVPILVDGAQAVPHFPVNVQDLDCDFYVFSGHKLYGPTGIGVLYGKSNLLDSMPPYHGGGDMIETVSFEHITFTKIPHKFEAGTPDIAGVLGLSAAIQYVQTIGLESIYSHEQQLLHYAENKLSNMTGVTIVGTSQPKVGVISFVIDNIHPHDIGTVLDNAGIAVRAGHHCAMPLMERFGLPATVRISFGLYNNEHDIDLFIHALNETKRIFS